ncbi:hypothetical protein BD770DRAFT_469026 [Pilaira anomala]|nr:hypothetical protein BD770DRAFT_469026 [Pilaira anomala]
MSFNAFRSYLRPFFVQQRTYTAKKPTSKLWSLEESKQLLDFVKIYGRDWVTIAPHFKDRGRKSLSSRYLFMKKQESGDVHTLFQTGEIPPDHPIVWTLEDDKLILELVKRNGHKWKEISAIFKDRSADDIAQRYTLLINDDKIKRGSWTKEETAEFDKLFAIYGDDFVSLSLKLGTRTEEQCRLRYRYLMGLPVTVYSLSEGQISRLLKAIEEIGPNDFKAVLKKAQLPYSITADDVAKFYRRELDPKIVKDEWTKEEVELMVDLYNELDGCMELVQPRLPKKRALKDMWTHYNDYKQKHLL